MFRTAQLDRRLRRILLISILAVACTAAQSLRAQTASDVRDAFFDLDSASELVNVARSNTDLAQETLAQAQESVSSANQADISSLYAFNIAKVQLARAVGIAEQAVKGYLGA